MSHPQRRKFRSHLVNHEVRLRLVLDDMAFAFIAALAAIGILYFLSNREIGDSLWSAHLSIKETKELLDNGVKVAGLVVFVAVLIFGFWSMLDAHRIVGPMHRLKLLLDQIAAGNEIFSPRQADYDHAELILEAYEWHTSAAGGAHGAVMLGDEMLDEASRKMALGIAAKGRAAGMERQSDRFVPPTG